MRWLGRKFASFLWWTYPRGSLEYDIMVAVILAFIFLTPRHAFRDQPRPPQPPGHVFALSLPGGDAALGLLLLAPAQAAAPTSLQATLAAITAAAPGIHSVSAHASVADYTALVQDTTRSSGMLYFKRTASGALYSLDLTTPAASAKHLVYRDQTGYIYTPSSKQVIQYPLGGKQNLVDQLLLLGMGSTGADLTASFEVAYDGPATLDGTPTVQLSLTPRSPDLKSKFDQIQLWYDPHTWIAIQQKVLQPGGDYHLVRYTDVKLNPKLSDDLFSAKFPGATVVTPHP